MTTVDAGAGRRLAAPTWLAPVAVFVIGAAAMTMSPSVSIWIDESVTISAAERTLPELFELVARIDAVHALYYMFMGLWVDVFGASSLSLRLPSALAAGGTALGAYALARRLTSPATALITGVFCATLPRMTWAGIEARPFVFSALAAVWTTVLLVRALQVSRPMAWIWYGIVAAVGVVTNIYLALLVVAHAVTVLMLRRRRPGTVPPFAITVGAVVLVTAPFLVVVRSQQAQLGTEGDRSALSILRKIIVNQFFLGETPDAEYGPVLFTRAWQIAAVAAAVVGIVLMLMAVVRRPPAGEDRSALVAVCLPFIVIPTLVVAVYAVLVSPIYQPRYFTFTAPAVALLMASGLRTIRRPWAVMSISIVYGLCVLVVFASQRTPFAKSGSDWAAAAAAVAERAEPGDAVFFAPRYADQDPVDQTTRRIAVGYPDAFADLTDLTLAATGAETGTIDGFSKPLPDAVADLEEYERIWGLYNKNALARVKEDSDATFDELGYTSNVVWDGPSTTVVEYSRVP